MLTIAAMATLAGSAPAQKNQPLDRILIDTDLNQHPIRLVSIEDHAITAIDSTGESRSIPFDQFLALTPSGPWSADPSEQLTVLGRGGIASRPGAIELTDGQRLAGAASVVRVDDQSVAWVHPQLGIVRTPIDTIERITMPRVMPLSEQSRPLPIENVDVVRLANGDTLHGFVISVGSETEIELESGSTISVPTASIDQLTLANETSAPSGTVVWLSDGSVIAIQSFEHSDSPSQTTCILQPDSFQEPFDTSPASEANSPKQPIRLEVDLDSITAINVDAHRLIPLASISPTSTGRDVILDDTVHAILGAKPILLPGPMRTTWTLPHNTRAIAMVAELPLEARAWGDVNLIISIDGTQRQTLHFNADTPQATIRLDAPGARTLGITLEQGPFGPIQSRIRLHQALISVDR